MNACGQPVCCHFFHQSESGRVSVYGGGEAKDGDTVAVLRRAVHGSLGFPQRTAGWRLLGQLQGRLLQRRTRQLHAQPEIGRRGLPSSPPPPPRRACVPARRVSPATFPNRKYLSPGAFRTQPTLYTEPPSRWPRQECASVPGGRHPRPRQPARGRRGCKWRRKALPLRLACVPYPSPEPPLPNSGRDAFPQPGEDAGNFAGRLLAQERNVFGGSRSGFEYTSPAF